MHLFDIDIPGVFTFRESDTLSPGDDLTMFETDFCKIGVGICYDLGFPEFCQIMYEVGCEFIIFPAAFSM